MSLTKPSLLPNAPPWNAFPAPASEYLRALHAASASRGARETAALIENLTRGHDQWRAACLNMNAAENTMSRRTRALLDSALATRVTEGFPGNKEFPPARQNVQIDEIEATLILLARELFSASYVEWRPVSTSMANAVAYFALTEPGDALLVQPMEGG